MQRKIHETFKPHAYLLGTAHRPTQITIFGMTGGHQRWHRIDFDVTKSPVTFSDQAYEVVRRTPETPFFGPTTGYVVNYTPAWAVRFDLKGAPLKSFDWAYVPQSVSLTIGGRAVSAEILGKMLGSLSS